MPAVTIGTEVHEPLPAKGTFTVNLSGVASAQGASDDQGQGGGQEGNSRQGGPEVIATPSRLDGFKWYIFGGMAALFAMSGILLSRKRVVVAGGVAGEGTEVAPVKSVAPAVKTKKVSAATAAPAKIAAEVESQVAVTMESLKEQIFRLELRRQAGTISEEDYEREKARVDKTLRDMVQG